MDFSQNYWPILASLQGYLTEKETRKKKKDICVTLYQRVYGHDLKTNPQPLSCLGRLATFQLECAHQTKPQLFSCLRVLVRAHKLHLHVMRNRRMLFVFHRKLTFTLCKLTINNSNHYKLRNELFCIHVCACIYIRHLCHWTKSCWVSKHIVERDLKSREVIIQKLIIMST